LAPQASQGFRGVAIVYSTQRQWKKAIFYYGKAISLSPDVDYYYHERGLCNLSLDNNSQAAKDFAKVIEINPKHDDSYYRLGLIEINNKNWDKAIGWLDKAHELAPQNQYYIRDLATAYIYRNKGNDKKQALGLLKDLLKKNPNDIDARNRLKQITPIE
jgi:tetratricopeptide (TPR) repeat protein